MAGISLQKGGVLSLSQANDSADSQVARTKILIGMIDNTYIQQVNIIDEVEILLYDLTEDTSMKEQMLNRPSTPA
jgi:hypothetical protein